MKNNYSIKIKDKKLFVFNIIFMLLAIAIGLIKNNVVEFIFTTLIFVCILIKAKISYFTFFSAILWFSFLQQFFASIDPLLASGRLKWDTTIPVYYQELYICTIYFFLIELLIFSVSNVLDTEKEIYKFKIMMSNKIAIILALTSLILIILAYPTIPVLSADLLRDKGIIPSSLIVPIALVILATTIDFIKKNKLIMMIWIIENVWILFHGDRVIVFGLAIYVILKYLNIDFKKSISWISTFFNKKSLLIIGGGVVLVVIGIRIHTTRMGNLYEFDLSNLINSILKQGTAADVVHCFNCATNMWKTGNTINGYTYMQYLVNWIPFLEDPYAPSLILMKKYNTLGGGLFFCEPMMNNGIIGTFVYSTLFLLLITWIYSKKTLYRSFLAIPLTILIFRFTWYASLAGYISMSAYVIPFLYFVIKKVK